ncbi:MAG: thioredoxin domain-containing protein [Myxococcales bacterium]|nr:thioredoxin domain-containing protein [Myxococcales bacterium]
MSTGPDVPSSFSIRDLLQILVLLTAGLVVGYVVGRDRGRLEGQLTVAAPAAAPTTDPMVEGTAVAALDPVPAPPAGIAALSPASDLDRADVSEAPATPDVVEDGDGWVTPPNLIPPEAAHLPVELKRLIPNTPYSLAGTPIQGDVHKARIIVTLFGDFQCQFTRDARISIDRLRGALGDDVAVGFRHLPLDFHSDAKPAAMASIAAQQQGKFWEYAQRLFDNQARLDDATLRSHAEALGLDMARFDADRKSPQLANILVVDKLIADAIEADGTPTLLLNGRKLVGSLDPAVFDMMVKQTLAEVESYRAEGLDLIAARGKACNRAAMRMPLQSKPETNIENLRNLPFGKLPKRGAPDPLIGIVVFSDFECPPCAKMAKKIEAAIAKDADVGTVFRHNPLARHSHARDAAAAALFAEDYGKFWEMHDRLFGNQSALDRASLVRYAKEIGLDTGLFEKALATDAFRTRIDEDRLLAGLVGVRATPTIFVNGRRLENPTEEEIATALNDAREQAKRFQEQYEFPREGYYERLMKDVPPN